MSMSHNYNNGLGLSVKQSQLRHSQHFHQSMLQSQYVPSSSPGMISQQHHMQKSNGSLSGHKSSLVHGNIKIQQPSSNMSQLKGFSTHHKFAKSECPTPKSHEVEQRVIASNQQKWFSRKGSGVNQAQVQNIQMTGIGH